MIIVAGNAQQIDVTRKYSSDELKEDLNYLFASLESIHPNLYAYANRSDIANEIRELEKELNSPMTRIEFARKVIPIVTKFKDAHTSLVFPTEERNDYFKNGGKIFPFDVVQINGQLLIKTNYSEDKTLLPGLKIISINNRTVGEVLNQLRQYVSAELDFYRDVRVQEAFKRLLWFVTGMEGDYDIQIDNHGKIENHFVKGIKLKELEALQMEYGIQQKIKPFSFYKLDGTQAGVIDFRQMTNLKKFELFLDSVFLVAKKDHLQQMVIDIRDNGGGNSRLGDALFNYITDKPYLQAVRMEIKTSKQLKKNTRKSYVKWYMYPVYPLFYFAGKQARASLFKKNGSVTVFESIKPTVPKKALNKFPGKTYLLTSHYTFSSANMLSDTYKCYQMGTVVGEETGGVLSPYGDLIAIRLPNTHLDAFCSHKKFVHPCADNEVHGVKPDVALKPTVEDVQNGRDVVMEYMKKLLAQ
ncbi:hypothetical protein WSM22_04280 [Cytophagales bacterium WSM2-2]|nr:hypothetical protein WSM22_04280 [Cytophagales bacterium WSM2-2]